MCFFQNDTSEMRQMRRNQQPYQTQPREVKMEPVVSLTPDHFTFGAGRRICSGIHLAENSLFILTGISRPDRSSLSSALVVGLQPQCTYRANNWRESESGYLGL